jgi:hypothetical protein
MVLGIDLVALGIDELYEGIRSLGLAPYSLLICEWSGK